MSCQMHMEMDPEQMAEAKRLCAISNNTTFLVDDILIPILCMFGILGNIMNIAILTRHHLQNRIDGLEKTAYMGLTALAISDMLYCLVYLPRGYLVKNFHTSSGFTLYYHLYSESIINMLLMSSTGLTVVMAIARYFAVCRPLHARHILSMRCTKVALTFVFVTSVVFNLPKLWFLDVYPHTSVDNNKTIYYVIPGPLVNNDNIHIKNFGLAYRFLWAACGSFIPLAILVICNIGLLRSLKRSQRERETLNARGGALLRREHQRLTLTLVVIIGMFCVLVAPYEITMFALEMSNKEGFNMSAEYVKNIVLTVMNMLQTLNFSTNFVLYCAVNTLFRKVICKWLHMCNPKHSCYMSPYRFYVQSQTSTSISAPMTDASSEV